jgi:hypothetical protein
MKVRTRFWLEAILAALSTGLFILTLLSRNWIEIVFGVDPDNSSGSLEWLIVAALLVASIVFVAMARAEWRRPQTSIS